MNVLLASAYFDSHRGGIEIVAGRLAREFAARGCEVSWLAADATQPVLDEAMRFTPVPIRAWNVTERRLGIPFPMPGPWGIAAIWRAVSSREVVVMHDGLYPNNVVAMLAAKWRRKPVILVQHIAAVPYANPVLRGVMRAANAMVARPMLAAADQVVFISETVAGYFADVRFKAPPQVIFNGVDTGVFALPPPGFKKSDVRSRLGLPRDGRVVTFVGRFVEKKGLIILERLARLRPELTFALAGWGPIDPNSWRHPNVHVFSELQGASLVPLYQASDCFVLPSTGEGLPLVMQEALACGLPVVTGRETASADPAATEFIEGVEIGTGAPDATAVAFADRIDRVLLAAAGPNHGVAAMARNAFVRERYSWAQAATQYMALMEILVTERTVPAQTRPAVTHRTSA